MKTVDTSGWKAAQNKEGLKGEDDDFPTDEPIYLTDMELQALLDRLNEMEKMGDMAGT